MGEEYHFWWSDQQYKKQLNSGFISDRTIYRNYAKIDGGKVVQYTEARIGEDKPTWEDVVYLGKGKIDHSEVRR